MLQWPWRAVRTEEASGNNGWPRFNRNWASLDSPFGTKASEAAAKSRAAKRPDKQRGNSDFFVKCPSIPVVDYRFPFLLYVNHHTARDFNTAHWNQPTVLLREHMGTCPKLAVAQGYCDTVSLWSSVYLKLNLHFPALRRMPWPWSYWGNGIATQKRQCSGRLMQTSPRNYEFWVVFTEWMQRDFYSVWFILCLKLFSSSYE